MIVSLDASGKTSYLSGPLISGSTSSWTCEGNAKLRPILEMHHWAEPLRQAFCFKFLPVHFSPNVGIFSMTFLQASPNYMNLPAPLA